MIEEGIDGREVECAVLGNSKIVENQPYIIKAAPDETPINIKQIIDFVDNNHFCPQEIRKTVEHLTWKIQMKHVLDEVNSETYL